MADKAAKHKFSADRPIISHSDDLLGVAGFAESLATSIKGWTGRDSLIVALYGPWGSGKSSIKNLAVEALRGDKEHCPSIVEFNPWQWAGQAQLAEGFFQEIGVALGFKQKDKQNKKRASKWRSYAAYLKMGSFLAGSLRSIIAWLLFILGFIAMGSGLFVDPAHIKTIIIVTGALAIPLAALFRWGGAFVDNVVSIFEAKSKVQEKSLAEIKKELSKLLQELSSPVLVIIDDVDRLSKEEIKYLFQLIKANADFPNLVYLLLFQRDLIEKHFDPEFLEKIVQVGFDIPRIEHIRLEKTLFRGLDELLSENIAEKRFDQHYWGNLFVPGLRPFFETLRDVHRFLATLSFHLALFRNKNSFEVNSVDLIGLEVIRVFEPKVYQHLFELKPILTGQHESYRSDNKAIEETRKTLESVILQSSENRRQPIQEIIKVLFPRAERYLGGTSYGGGFEDKWYRDLRVCHPDVFDRYFHFAIPEGDIAQADLDRILSSTANRETLVAEMQALNKRGMLKVFLDRLESYKEEIDINHAVPFITALFDIGDELPEDEPGFFMIGSHWHAVRVVYWYLKKEPDIKKRGQILKQASNDSTGLYLTVMRASLEEDLHKKPEDVDKCLLDQDDLNELKKICVGKIVNAAAIRQLEKHKQRLTLLFHWGRWAGFDDSGKYVKNLINTQEGLLSFMISALSRSTSQGFGDYVARIHWSMKLSTIEPFIQADIVLAKVEQLNTENLNEEEKRAIDAFRKALKRREEGKSEDSFFNDD